MMTFVSKPAHFMLDSHYLKPEQQCLRNYQPFDIVYDLTEFFYHLDSPRNSYQASSYSTYTLPGKANEKADGLQHSSDFLDRFRNQISMQLRLDPGVTRTPLFLAVSEDGKEYSRLRVGHNICELQKDPARKSGFHWLV